MKKINLFIIVLAVMVGILGFYYYQKNIYSKEILKLEILAPEEAELLQEIEYVVKYKNNGDTRLEEPELVFEYPEHSLPAEGTSLRVTKSSNELGEAIYPGQEKTFRFRARLLGKEGETKEAKATLSYRPKNLKAKYESTTTFTTTIKSVPLTFEFDLPSQVESGKNFVFRINYFSSVDFALNDLKAQVEYPSGFEFLESTPKSIEKNEWKIPVLNKSQGGRIEISGRLSGEVGEAKIFKAKLGVWREEEFVLLKEITKGVEIIKPSIYLRQEINGNPQYAALPGDWLHYEIYFKNIGDEALSNLFMVAKLEGDAFDFQTIKSDFGDFQPGDNSIIFDWRRVSKLQYLAPMDEGKADFWINLKDNLGEIKDPILRNKVFISQVKEEFITKISSKLEIAQKGYFQDEIFGNSGSLPPKVGQSTTYTIIWQVKNYYSDVKDAKVKTVLPEGVGLTGKIFPETEASKFAFDSQSREITWSAGDIEKGKGVLGPAPNIAFQIEFVPNESQKGKTPEIISSAEITGQDSWTGITLQATAAAVDTTLPDDPAMARGMGIIQ